MNRLTAMIVLLLCLVPAITLANVGIVTRCWKDGNPISSDTVFAALCTADSAAWNVYTKGYTGLYDNVVVWGVSGINPDVELPTGNFYQFYAKHPGGSGGDSYSNWSAVIFYAADDQYDSINLNLNLTSDPGAPHWP